MTSCWHWSLSVTPETIIKPPGVLISGGIEWEHWHEIEYWRMISWYRNRSIDLLCKSDDLFLFQENINNKECLKELRKYTNMPVFHDTLNSITFAMRYIPIQLTKLVITNFQSEIKIICCRNILQFRDIITLLSPAQ